MVVSLLTIPFLLSLERPDFIWENKSSLFLSLIIEEEQIVPVPSLSLSGLNNCCRAEPTQQCRALIGKAGSRFSLSDCVVKQ